MVGVGAEQIEVFVRGEPRGPAEPARLVDLELIGDFESCPGHEPTCGRAESGAYLGGVVRVQLVEALLEFEATGMGAVPEQRQRSSRHQQVARLPEADLPLHPMPGLAGGHGVVGVCGLRGRPGLESATEERDRRAAAPPRHLQHPLVRIEGGDVRAGRHELTSGDTRPAPHLEYPALLARMGHDGVDQVGRVTRPGAVVSRRVTAKDGGPLLHRASVPDRGGRTRR